VLLAGRGANAPLGHTAMRRGDEHCLGRDGCRRARALGGGGVERAV